MENKNLYMENKKENRGENRNSYEDLAPLNLYGKNAVFEALNSNATSQKNINCLYVSKNFALKNAEIINLAKGKGAVIKEVSPEKLDFLSEGNRNGGVILSLSSVEYSTLEEILNVSKEKNLPPFIIAADSIEDPHNLGALIRTAESAGADGLIIPKRRSATLTGAVFSASAGAAAHLKIARVVNLTDALKELKKLNIFVYGAESDGTPYTKIDFKGGACLVVGSEGEGLHRLVRETCDFIVSIPMFGKLNSLNASVSGGILTYEIAKNRYNY